MAATASMTFLQRLSACAPAAAAPSRAVPWALPLPRRGAVTLRAVRRTRWLLVTCGRVWASGGPPRRMAQDHWLAAGERIEVPAGTTWVVGAEPAAEVIVAEAVAP
jgi:hypothetical protein